MKRQHLTGNGVCWITDEELTQIGRFLDEGILHIKHGSNYHGPCINECIGCTVVAEFKRLEAAVRFINDVAVAWHGNDEAKARALNVIAKRSATVLESLS